MKQCRTIIFSRNRPLQLDLCLKTLLNHCTDILQQSEITVLYRNDEEYRKSFGNLMSEFPQISFKKEKNFKKDLLSVLSNESNISWGKNSPTIPDFVTFIVDDQIFTENFSMSVVEDCLDKNKDCIGFSLRLGKNCVRCFPYDCEQTVPKTEKVSKNIVKYNWQEAEYDFNYCLELSASTYRINDLIEMLDICDYDSPNSLESIMSSCFYKDKPNLLMFAKSSSFSYPMNKVQISHPNRSGDFNPDTLRLIYEKGGRFESKQFDGYVSSGAHEIPESINLVDTYGK
jgi:hypothetical protein